MFLKRILIKIYLIFIRPFTPESDYIIYSNIKINKKRKVFDKYLLKHISFINDRPNYETGLSIGIRKYMKKDDSVIIIGGGLGVTSAIAKIIVGDIGSVICYEGSKKSINMAIETAKINNLENKIIFKHSIVAKNIGVYGPIENDIHITHPNDLPSCDFLELDCEGAEKIILEQINIRPRIILVETHGYLGSSSQVISSLLSGLGYFVNDLGEADIDCKEFCLKNDVRVLVGLCEKSFNKSS